MLCRCFGSYGLLWGDTPLEYCIEGVSEVCHHGVVSRVAVVLGVPRHARHPVDVLSFC